MRGKPDGVAVGAALERITPAGAGKTQGRDVIAGINRDHPRRCGENVIKFGTLTSLTGSPPQVRGKRYNYLMDSQGNRITPAGAGKT